MTESRLVLLAAALSALVGVLYVVLLVHGAPLAGDQLDYDAYGRYAADGMWFWLDKPYGVPGPSAWKTPGYPAWVGVWYSLGLGRTGVGLVQAVTLGPAIVALTWRLARRFGLGERARVAVAFGVALYPAVWQWTGLLYADALAIPLALAVLLVALTGGPSPRRAAAVGALLGACLLVRPTSFLLLAGVLAAWLFTAGLKRTAAGGAIAIAVAALILAPWLIRNADVAGAPILSVQDAALAGTFNPTAANDDEYPFAWRPLVERDVDLFDPGLELSDSELRSRLIARGRDYIADHPSAVPKALFYNGIVRTFDLRTPSKALVDQRFEGRVRGVSVAALVLYYALAPLALLGLWRIRRDRPLCAALTATLAATAVVFTVVGGTRYRAPLEPVILLLALRSLRGG